MKRHKSSSFKASSPARDPNLLSHKGQREIPKHNVSKTGASSASSSGNVIVTVVRRSTLETNSIDQWRGCQRFYDGEVPPATQMIEKNLYRHNNGLPGVTLLLMVVIARVVLPLVAVLTF